MTLEMIDLTVPAHAFADDLSVARVVTDIPGPKSSAMLKRQKERESNAVSYPVRLPIAIRRARGSYVEDFDGNMFIDFLTGAGSLPLGHSHPEVVEAARRQLGEFCHGLDFPSDAKDQFLEAHRSMLPQALRNEMKAHFCGPTGADAVEAALKLCKLYTGGDEIIAFQGGYHGCTHAAMSVTGLRSMKAFVGNRMPGVHFFPYSYCYRCPLGLQRSGCEINCIQYLERAIADPNSGLGRPAAVLVELVQGEGGVIPAEREFVTRLRRLTQERGIPLIVDEIQTGCGRTGSWFAFEQYDIEPDVILASKGLSGIGLPVALMFYRRKMDTWSPGAHIGTFRGNQIAFAAGAMAVKVICRDRVLEQAARMGDYLRDRLEALAREFAIVGEVRGRGLMLGLEIVDPASGAYDSRLAARIQQAALHRGLILELGGRNDCVVRLLPPLNITRRTADEALTILCEAIEDASPFRKQSRNGVGDDYII
jgi:diaminobutyrate-2-oxoglutarate transaminase